MSHMNKVYYACYSLFFFLQFFLNSHEVTLWSPLLFTNPPHSHKSCDTYDIEQQLKERARLQNKIHSSLCVSHSLFWCDTERNYVIICHQTMCLNRIDRSIISSICIVFQREKLLFWRWLFLVKIRLLLAAGNTQCKQNIFLCCNRG